MDYRITASPCRHAGARYHVCDRTADGKSEIVTDTFAPALNKLTGTLAPGASESLSVWLIPGAYAPHRNKTLGAFADSSQPVENLIENSLQIIIEDASVSSAAAQKVQIRLVNAEIPSPVPSAASLRPALELMSPTGIGSACIEVGPTQAALLPFLELRGCTPVQSRADARKGSAGIAATRVNSRYEVNIGQKTMHQMNVEWEITLHNRSDSIALPYRLYVVHQEAAVWLRVGRDCGVLKPLEAHDIMLGLGRRQFGVFESYIMLENELNPADFKIIRVSMEVVSEPMSQGGEMLFEVLISGAVAPTRDAPLAVGQSTIHYGNVYCDLLQNKRSFVLHNCSQVPLDFQLASTLGASLCFSRSSTILKKVTEVTCEPRGYLQVYIFFVPPMIQDETNPSQGVEIDEALYISCRLVKDFRRTIRLRARCHLPSMKVVAPWSTGGSTATPLVSGLEASLNQRVLFTRSGASMSDFGSQEVSILNLAGTFSVFCTYIMTHQFKLLNTVCSYSGAIALRDQKRIHFF